MACLSGNRKKGLPQAHYVVISHPPELCILCKIGIVRTIVVLGVKKNV